MMKSVQILLLVTVALMLQPDRGSAQEIRFQSSVNKNVIGLNEPFQLILQISGPQASTIGTPQLPAFEGLVVLGFQGSSTSIQFVNGVMSATKSYTYLLRPDRLGKVTIPSMQIKVGDKSYATTPITVEVVSDPPGSAANPPGKEQQEEVPGLTGDDVYLAAIVSKKNLYQGEQVVVNFKLFTRVQVTSYSIVKKPDAEGLWAEEFPFPTQPTLKNELINGVNYRTAIIGSMAFFPTKPGKLTIDPMILNCEVRVSAKKKRSNFWDDFFQDDFFGSRFGKVVEQKIQTRPVVLTVRPFPEAGKPADFTGTVGDFSVTHSIDKAEIKAGNALTYRLTISGTGNVKSVELPNVIFPEGFEQYEPEISDVINRNGRLISGSKTAEYILIPRVSGKQVIPSVQFHYFDPIEVRYVSRTLEPITIEVERGNASLAGGGFGGGSGEVAMLTRDIRFIKTEDPEFHREIRPVYLAWWFFGLMALPMFVLAGSYLYKRNTVRRSGDVVNIRYRKASSLARRRLKGAKKLIRTDLEDGFYAEMSKALLGFLADKLNVPGASIISAEVKTILKAKDVPAETVEKYIACIQECDFARFAPGGDTQVAFGEFYQKVEDAILDLDKEL